MANFGIGIDIFPIDDMFDDEQTCRDFVESIILIKRRFKYKLLKPSKKNVWWKRIGIKLVGIYVLPFSLKELIVKLNEYILAS